MADEKPESEKSLSERRRKKYINPSFQNQFIFQFTFLMVLGCLAFGLSIYLYSQQTFTTAFLNSKLRVMNTADFLFPALILVTLVVTTVVSFVSGLRLLLFSHRIAGPLYRLEKSVEAIGGGNLSLQIRLRSGDELQEFARSMDGMVRDLRARAQQIKKQNDRLREILLQADQIPGFPKDILQVLRDTQRELNQAVSHFRV